MALRTFPHATLLHRLPENIWKALQTAHRKITMCIANARTEEAKQANQGKVELVRKTVNYLTKDFEVDRRLNAFQQSRSRFQAIADFALRGVVDMESAIDAENLGGRAAASTSSASKS
jgi:hypothetical protein